MLFRSGTYPHNAQRGQGSCLHSSGIWRLWLWKACFNQSSPLCLEALEDSVVWVANFSEVEFVVNEHQELERLMRLLLVSAIKSLTERLYLVKFQTAQERYQWLLNNYPQILLVTALIHAFIPGASPPEVRTAIALILFIFYSNTLINLANITEK